MLIPCSVEQPSLNAMNLGLVLGAAGFELFKSTKVALIYIARAFSGEVCSFAVSTRGPSVNNKFYL